eukprot:TRINITY_DN2464_c1_g1_i1.p1 TRINITY_DN2464_c1_g1~~TRINITY_DN2464_c1_g1_i1.p1  ORF type:complete len:667 (+),score=74.39 TRINITY_DN2464_c1_g1_i1:27-2003(+)
MADSGDHAPFLLVAARLWHSNDHLGLRACLAAAASEPHFGLRDHLSRQLGLTLAAHRVDRDGRREAAARFAAALNFVAGITCKIRRARRGVPRHEVGGEKEERSGGFLLTTSHAKGECRRALDEFILATARHAPDVVLRQGSAGASFAFLEVRGPQNCAASLEAVFDAMKLSGEGFRHVRRVYPFDGVCGTSVSSVCELLQRVAKPALSVPTTVAIHLHTSGLHVPGDSLPSRKEYIAAIGEAILQDQTVDLDNPSTIVHVRMFDGRCGICVRPSSCRLDCPTSCEDVYATCSSDQAYYKRNVNCGRASEGEVAPGALPETIADLDAWHARLTVLAQSTRSCSADILASSREYKLDRHSHTEAAERQVTALTELVRSAGLLELSSVEFGAGRGTLTKCLHSVCAAKSAIRVLVDRDRAHGGTCQYTNKSRFTEEFALRLRIDIRNLWLAGLPELQGSDVVGIGKHVCGCATDFALRCLCAKCKLPISGDTQAPLQTEEEAAALLKSFPRVCRRDLARRVGREAFVPMSFREQVQLLQTARPPRVAGAVIALCCHHRCTWESYCNPDWLEAHEVSAVDFQIICRMSSWAVSSPSGPLGATRKSLGRHCKDFLDAGRAEYLARHGFQAKVVEYCSREETAENRALVAVLNDALTSDVDPS